MDFEPGQDEAAVAFIHQNYPEETARQLLSSLVDIALGRGVCICKSCQPHVEQGHLQRYVPSVHLQPRFCDYVVDPCHVNPITDNAGTLTYVATERFEEWCSGAAAPASARPPPAARLARAVRRRVRRARVPRGALSVRDAPRGVRSRARQHRSAGREAS